MLPIKKRRKITRHSYIDPYNEHGDDKLYYSDVVKIRKKEFRKSEKTRTKYSH